MMHDAVRSECGSSGHASGGTVKGPCDKGGSFDDTRRIEKDSP